MYKVKKEGLGVEIVKMAGGGVVLSDNLPQAKLKKLFQKYPQYIEMIEKAKKDDSK